MKEGTERKQAFKITYMNFYQMQPTALCPDFTYTLLTL